MQTPWGKAQGIKEIAEGIKLVFTASHGGFKLDRQRNKLVPEAFRNKGGWYEEDCECAKVILTFPQYFDERQIQVAHQTAKNYFPFQYEIVYGVLIPLEESSEKREIDFREKTKDLWVAWSAWGDWEPTVPKGMVGVKAQKGQEEAYFLVKREDYPNNPMRHVVDNSYHIPWNKAG